ncbi:hypothetical protein [Haloferula sp. A504]|uniref:hypothetical protein n=1 Tax=Haloferula sp. A504 TaxID=3373601 RepID=UPI0031C02823|nr:hypothetical protein [Verrucomicrobiaceae bacterium E54]
MKLPALPLQILLLAMLLGSPPSLYSQGEDKVALRFLTFPKQLERQSVELLTGEGRTIEVEPPSNELSKTIRVPRMSSWVFGETTVNEDGETTFNTFGKAPSLSASNQLLILVRKGDRFEEGIEIIPVDGRISRFGGGEFFFMNATTVDIGCEAAGKKFAVRPKSHYIFDPEASGRTAHFTFYFRKADEARPFWSSRWPVADYARALVFFYHDPQTKRLRIHSIRDFLDKDS